jgi:hypothetical protein
MARWFGWLRGGRKSGGEPPHSKKSGAAFAGIALARVGIEERSFVATLLWMTAKGGWREGTIGGGAGGALQGTATLAAGEVPRRVFAMNLLRRASGPECGPLSG